jgi:hypothetical protein
VEFSVIPLRLVQNAKAYNVKPDVKLLNKVAFPSLGMALLDSDLQTQVL